MQRVRPRGDSGTCDAHRERAAGDVRTKLDRLRTDLIDLAFVLETRGRLEAADVALATSARVGELCDELACDPCAIARAERVESDAGFRATL
jgi:hypothetical protein